MNDTSTTPETTTQKPAAPAAPMVHAKGKRGQVYDPDGEPVSEADPDPDDGGGYMSGRDADREAEAHFGRSGFRGNKY